jgi:hypothetical protein
MENKLCKTCNLEKPIDSFYKQKGRKSMSNCKECRRIIMRKYEAKFPEKVKATQDLWRKNNPEKVKATQVRARKSEAYKLRMELNRERDNKKKRDYMKTEQGRIISKNKYLKTKLLSPQKLSARNIIAKAVKRGKLQKLAFCTYPACLNEKVEAHHFNYSKELEVKWLCKRHHRIADKVKQMFNKYHYITNSIYV